TPLSVEVFANDLNGWPLGLGFFVYAPSVRKRRRMVFPVVSHNLQQSARICSDNGGQETASIQVLAKSTDRPALDPVATAANRFQPSAM
ncbi:MAG: hypothetical protein JJ992_19885, partial [Planctomycetes bacterium]|nr:hypothetical protein [Planctomycetota bacterium]